MIWIPVEIPEIKCDYGEPDNTGRSFCRFAETKKIENSSSHKPHYCLYYGEDIRKDKCKTCKREFKEATHEH